MEKLIGSFEKTFSFKLKTPFKNQGNIQSGDLNINYVLGTDSIKRKILDLLIFNEILPPRHKRINANGEITDLENFQFSIMYENENDEVKEMIKMKNHNKSIAQLMLNKGLANKSDGWIQKYL